MISSSFAFSHDKLSMCSASFRSRVTYLFSSNRRSLSSIVMEEWYREVCLVSTIENRSVQLWQLLSIVSANGCSLSNLSTNWGELNSLDAAKLSGVKPWNAFKAHAFSLCARVVSSTIKFSSKSATAVPAAARRERWRQQRESSSCL